MNDSMNEQFAGLLFTCTLVIVMGLIMIGNSEGAAKRFIFWKEGDNPESYKPIQKGAIFFGTVLIVIGVVGLVVAIIGLILKSQH